MRHINEYLKDNERYVVKYYSKKSGNGTAFGKSITDCQYKLPDDVEYYDISDNTNMNLSAIDALVAWWGEGGYWANQLNNPKQKNIQKQIKDKQII